MSTRSRFRKSKPSTRPRKWQWRSSWMRARCSILTRFVDGFRFCFFFNVIMSLPALFTSRAVPRKDHQSQHTEVGQHEIERLSLFCDDGWRLVSEHAGALSAVVLESTSQRCCDNRHMALNSSCLRAVPCSFASSFRRSSSE